MTSHNLINVALLNGATAQVIAELYKLGPDIYLFIFLVVAYLNPCLLKWVSPFSQNMLAPDTLFLNVLFFHCM